MTLHYTSHYVSKSIYSWPLHSNMSTFANSLTVSEILPLESSHTGVPNARELFDDGYSWQHAVTQLDSQVHAHGRSIDPLSHVDFPFFGKKDNRGWVKLISWARREVADSIGLSSTSGRSVYQQKHRCQTSDSASFQSPLELCGCFVARHHRHSPIVSGR